MKTPSTEKLSDPACIFAEFAEVDLGDPRRNRRLQKVAVAAARHPSDSFPDQAESEAALEGTYRLLSNPNVSPRDVLAGHIAQSVKRAQLLGTVVAVQDTSTFSFTGEAHREGLGRLLKKGQGFFGHYCIGLSLDGRPVGTLGLETTVRSSDRKGRRSPAKSRNSPDNEQLRWGRTAQLVEQRLGPQPQVIHVMDREADDYAMFAAIARRKQHFVVRIFRDRNLCDVVQGQTSLAPKGSNPKLFEIMDQLPVVGQRTVQLSARPAKGPKSAQAIHPPRKARKATVALSGASVEIKRSRCADPALVPSLRLNVVQVREANPPQGQPAVLWRIITTQPVETVKDIERVIDIYCLRWTIEEFFKALKTGCAYQTRQLESYHALLNALAVFSAVAWRMLLLRYLDRTTPTASARLALTPTQLSVLTAVAPNYGANLPQQPTVHDAIMAIARIGGHLRRNGPPGWLVIARGFDKLLTMEQAYVAAMNALSGTSVVSPASALHDELICDQS